MPESTPWTPENTDGIDACDIVEAHLRLTKGAARGQRVRLRHWQGDVICDMLRRRPDGLRQYRTYELWVARKNSKSLLGAGLALDGLFDEPGAEVYSAAGDKMQARIVFGELRAAVEMDPELDAKQGGILKVYRDAIEYPPLGSVYRVLSSDAPLKEGLNPSRVIFDELHVQPDDELWNVLNQGSDTRLQALVVAISTFGARFDSQGRDSLGYREYLRCKRIMSGEEDDPTFGCRIYETPDPTCDHRDPANWQAANPALGDFLLLEQMESTCRKMPEADWRTKRMNVWVTSSTPWLPGGAWDACVQADASVPDGVDVVLGFDGSFSNDSTALMVATVEEQPRVATVAAWERTGYPEWRVPIEDVEKAILDACRRWQVREVACDPFRWARSMQVLQAEGVPIEAFPQSPARMVPATQRFFEAVVNGQVRHDGTDAGLARHLDNCVLKVDARGSRLDKAGGRGSARKIDRAVALVMAFDRASWHHRDGGDDLTPWGFFA